MVPQPDADALDRALVARMAGGDRDALELLYRRHAGWLTARLQRRCHDRESVDTALQDTFIGAWKGASRYAGEGEVAAWLWGIAVRRLADELRRRRPVPTEGVELGLASAALGASRGTVDDALPADQRMLDAGAHGDLADAFRDLDDDLRTVLLATAIDGLSTKETAQLLGIPQGTVKTRMMRARAQLRGRLQEPLP